MTLSCACTAKRCWQTSFNTSFGGVRGFAPFLPDTSEGGVKEGSQQSVRSKNIAFRRILPSVDLFEEKKEANPFSFLTLFFFSSVCVRGQGMSFFFKSFLFSVFSPLFFFILQLCTYKDSLIKSRINKEKESDKVLLN